MTKTENLRKANEELIELFTPEEIETCTPDEDWEKKLFKVCISNSVSPQELTEYTIYTMTLGMVKLLEMLNQT